MPKSIFKSRTFWMNVALGVVALFVEELMAAGFKPEWLVGAAAALNVLMRAITKKPVETGLAGALKRVLPVLAVLLLGCKTVINTPDAQGSQSVIELSGKGCAVFDRDGDHVTAVVEVSGTSTNIAAVVRYVTGIAADTVGQVFGAQQRQDNADELNVSPLCADVVGRLFGGVVDE